jgi:hypothetical protein
VARDCSKLECQATFPLTAKPKGAIAKELGLEKKNKEARNDLVGSILTSCHDASLSRHASGRSKNKR